MKRIFYNSIIAKGVLYFSKCDLIMLFGLVFSKAKLEKVSLSIINHEMVHVRLWGEVTLLSSMIVLALILIFNLNICWILASALVYYIWYIIEWMCKGIYYSIMNDDWDCQRKDPYKEISFEKEADMSKYDDTYLENSNYFNWIHYL